MDSALAAKRLELNGPNMLTPPKGKPEWLKFLEQMSGGFALLLWAGSLLSLVGYLIDQDEPGNVSLIYLIIMYVLGWDFDKRTRCAS